MFTVTLMNLRQQPEAPLSHSLHTITLIPSLYSIIITIIELYLIFGIQFNTKQMKRLYDATSNTCIQRNSRGLAVPFSNH